MSEVCDTTSVCVGTVSAADEKSRSSLLTKRCRVRGAEEESEVRMRSECSLTTPAKLHG
jgi:hypothetical protein